MLNDKSISVVIPAYNEELLIGRTIQTMPDFVDRMFVVNDGSKDRTKEIIEEFAAKDERVVLVDNVVNQGLGQSLINGYVAARDAGYDLIAVMAGDAQMSPADLEPLCAPLIFGNADYAKGNRLMREEVIERMPTHRFIGNNILTLLTKFATGYWHIIDPQCGYTVISHRALKTIPIETMIKGYGYNADILHMLNMNNFRVKDVEVEPVYGEEQSKIKLKSYIPTVSKLLLRLFWQRLKKKYMLREFHPLFMLYGLAIFNGIFLFIPMFFRFFYLYFSMGQVPQTTLMIMLFSFSFAMFSLVFAMWMDMEDNRKLIATTQ